jgi:hypothetical protein
MTDKVKASSVIYAGAARRRNYAVMNDDGTIERLEPKLKIAHSAKKVVLNTAGNFQIKLDGTAGPRLMWGGRVFEPGEQFDGVGEELLEAIKNAEVVPYNPPKAAAGTMTPAQLEAIEDGDDPEQVFIDFDQLNETTEEG